MRHSEYEEIQMRIEGKIDGKRRIGRKKKSLLRNIRYWTQTDGNTLGLMDIRTNIHKKYKNNIRTWEEIDEQIITLEIEKNGHSIVIIGAYAPSEDADNNIKDEFYDKLLNTILNINDRKEICILGDLNGRVGQKQNDLVVGQHGEQPVNDNGQRIINMCESLTLKIMNGFFPHREVHKFTWVQRTRRLSSIIDYMILRQNSILKTNDVRVYRGIECDSDHYLLMAKVVINYRSSKKEREEHKGNQGKVDSVNYNLDSLRHESVQFLYKLRLASKLQNIQIEQINTEELYKTIKDSIHQAAEEALGHKNIDVHKIRNGGLRNWKSLQRIKRKLIRSGYLQKTLRIREHTNAVIEKLKELYAKRKMKVGTGNANTSKGIWAEQKYQRRGKQLKIFDEKISNLLI
ncbi:uncharacterized protein LOC115876149 [Sitophilus oryzae]|uniref:Uncharacterized protein LOC115876149 n=1 Tax=Sitophilus oryzae TaxID=7048 RepID=A0A6J2X8Y2_SITOR|nr:uncharacterized protein LOC115876149 [Sitophilus oryzae]